MGVARVAGWLVFVCGCNLAWGIREVPPPDASVPQLCGDITSHDEDHDGVPDGCDVCPGIRDDQTDTDQDGVGDACDPDENSQQKIAYFEAFGDPDAATRWTIQGGAWAFRDDATVYSSTGTEKADLAAKTMVAGPYAIEAVVSIDKIEAQGSVLQLFADDAVYCGVYRENNTSSIDYVRIEAKGGSPNFDQPFLVLQNAERLRITMTYRPGATSDCTVTELSSLTTARAPLMLGSQTPGAFGIHDSAIPTHVEYVAVYAPVP